jgi:hypothetical protein
MMTAFDSLVRALANEIRLMMAMQTATESSNLRWWFTWFSSSGEIDRANLAGGPARYKTLR